MPVPSLVPLDSHLIIKSAGAADDGGKGVDCGGKSVTLRQINTGAGQGRGAESAIVIATHNLRQNPTLSIYVNRYPPRAYILKEKGKQFKQIVSRLLN